MKLNVSALNAHWSLLILVSTEYSDLTFKIASLFQDHLCGLVVRVPGYRFRDPGFDSGAARFSEK
jgi:hypothetical protein